MSASGLDNCSEGAFADFLENLVVLGDLSPYWWKAEFLDDLGLVLNLVSRLSSWDILIGVGLNRLVVEGRHVIK